MRTTLTLDPDVAVQLQQLQAKRHLPWKTLVNQTLREGVRSLSQTTATTPAKPFATHQADLGHCRYDQIDNVAEILAVAEGEDCR